MDVIVVVVVVIMIGEAFRIPPLLGLFLSYQYLVVIFPCFLFRSLCT